jgi:hypothetical protein
MENEKPLLEKPNAFLEADKMQSFLQEYQALCMKWGYMFIMQPPTIQKVEFMEFPKPDESK